ncbi:MAG: bifunctional phosphoglucose/phosphomannose isomerase [Candidatus Colwellbacteria bacterium]|nr:bifunctional phosphoglucose/phosphomannose isomerase [Candidatus Colwellbacteria bacterium]
MKESILNFPEQFKYKPEVTNSNKLRGFKRIIVIGMGGSHLAADLLKIYKPALDLVVHSNYGLPKLPNGVLEESIVILSSYSGNTEEVLSAFEECVKQELNFGVIASGGKLLELAKEHSIPYVELPGGEQPRMAVGFALRATLAILGENAALKESASLAARLLPQSLEGDGKKLAQKIKGFVPVIYSSSANLPIAYNWKIKFNETGKIPAFYNVFPELNHNEMNGNFEPLASKFYFIFLEDSADYSLIRTRMRVLEKIYKEKGLQVGKITLQGRDVWEKIFRSLILADWAAYYTALQYDLDPQEVPLVEEFKRIIAAED